VAPAVGAVVAAVLAAGVLTKLGHAWSAIGLLPVLCLCGAVFEGLLAIWRASRATRATRMRLAAPLKAQA